MHDLLVAKGGIALPATHGLRAAIERHKSRLTAEFTRTRIKRKCSTVAALRDHVEDAVHANSQHPRWIRINTLKSTLEDQLATTFQAYSRASSIHDTLKSAHKLICVDEHIPNLVAVSARFDFAKCDAYKSGAIILQDKASCFPAYLLDPQSTDGDAIDGCAAPGNKTTHLAAIMDARNGGSCSASIHAFERDEKRAKTLERMVETAGSDRFTHIHPGQDFLKVDPLNQQFSAVGTILLDPSCSGSGIVGRDDMPELRLPAASGIKLFGKVSKKPPVQASKKRKRQNDEQESEKMLVDDDGNTTIATSEQDLKARLEALSSFQLKILLHAFSFPAARRITYSTCSIHGEENERVVISALASEVAQHHGWTILPRDSQVSGMKAWPVRGQLDACDGNGQVAEACIRAHKDDGRGVMGFFVAAFERALPSSTVGEITKNTGTPVKRKRPHKDAMSNTRPSEVKIDPDTNEDEVEADSGDGSEWSGFDD